MLFQVFHYTAPQRFTEAAFATFPLGYRRVATVEAPELGAVFELTNHIHDNWTTGPAVVTLDDPRARSTSVGDVILATGDQLHGVAGMGLKALGKLKRCWFCQKPVTDDSSIAGGPCESCRDARLRMEDWARDVLKASPLESSADAAAEWDIDARMAEAAEKGEG